MSCLSALYVVWYVVADVIVAYGMSKFTLLFLWIVSNSHKLKLNALELFPRSFHLTRSWIDKNLLQFSVPVWERLCPISSWRSWSCFSLGNMVIWQTEWCKGNPVSKQHLLCHFVLRHSEQCKRAHLECFCCTVSIIMIVNTILGGLRIKCVTASPDQLTTI